MLYSRHVVNAHLQVKLVRGLEPAIVIALLAEHWRPAAALVAVWLAPFRACLNRIRDRLLEDAHIPSIRSCTETTTYQAVLQALCHSRHEGQVSYVPCTRRLGCCVRTSHSWVDLDHISPIVADKVISLGLGQIAEEHVFA